MSSSLIIPLLERIVDNKRARERKPEEDARKLVRAFGDKVFDVIKTEPERLREVIGIA